MEEKDLPTLRMIARIHSDFPDKFGIPRQSGLTSLASRIVFEPEFRDPNALRGIEGWSHLWILWIFSEAVRPGWSPTVRPPRLGGNERVGVFATRSPFRPNSIGLSSVKLERVEHTGNEGDVLIVSGADLMDGTPIIDIKPYVPYADAHPEASGGFAAEKFGKKLKVVFPEELLSRVEPGKREGLKDLLAEDPRPAVQDDPERVYGMRFSDVEIKFVVSDGVLTVVDVI
ncbi:MAG: tRNA (N6-threonylcarbamoyladenosine(37)-N6)-methyltransferase TrmO [Clostridiales bacterium]|nr:tRNA (N6-threonylcarbamoyladenosine(37)-N6)-methyltransferase TrmO [Clostridiales bacterium]MDY4435205.1 tRNA (N6-threonylcarbamoyladenosine(37)-N6)-methyltransferase TrmO [Candidatus Flemingibacterium sp.]